MPPERAASSPPARGRSLRLRILAIAAVTIVTTLTIGGLALSDMFENSLEQTIEQQLEVYWNELAAGFRLADGQTPAVERELSDPRFRTPFAGAYWRIDEKGEAILQSRSLWDQALVPTARRHLSPRGIAEEQSGPNDSTVYVLARPVTLQGENGGEERSFTLSVALDTAEMEDLRAGFAGDLARALALIGLLLFAGAVVQVSYGLAPLRLLRRRLAQVHAGKTARLAGPFPEEGAPLVEDLDALKIGRASCRERV